MSDFFVRDVIVIGSRPAFGPGGNGGSGGGGSDGGSGIGQGSGVENNPYLTAEGGGGPPTINCANVRSATSDMVVPDGANYYAPADIPGTYFDKAVEHIQNFRVAHNTFWAVKNEIVRMYTQKNLPYFVDFKRWGSPSGPDGSVSGGTYQYHSEAAGQTVTAGAFEAFGNWFFGVLCTMAGFSEAATEIAAAASSAQYGGNLFDDPQDRPHVGAGIAAAQKYINRQNLGQSTESLITMNPGC